MTKRMMIRIVSGALALTVVAGGIAITAWQRADRYRLTVENNYQRAFSELVGSISSINYALQKSCISYTPGMLVSLGSEIFKQSASASSALSQLPLTDLRLEKTSKFISQVGDWAYSISKRVAAGEKISNEERAVLTRLAGAANTLSADLNDLGVEINENSLQFGEIASAEKKLESQNNTSSVSGVAQNIAYLEQEFPEYPTLVYDGPFSEHIDRVKPMFLQDKKDIDENQAKKKAAEFLGVGEEEITSAGVSGGKIPVYTFYCERDGGQVSIDITVRGGAVVEMTDSRTPKQATLSLQEATQKAKDFLSKQGFGKMKESYWTVYSDTVMINFAPTEGEVVLYPDLVKVSVALDNGQICNFEAQGYIMNHKARTIPEPSITLEKAKSLVASNLQVKGYNLAIVPLSSGNEEFVYEMQCEREDGSHCLVYLGADNGEEVQIFILIEDDNGILAM